VDPTQPPGSGRFLRLVRRFGVASCDAADVVQDALVRIWSKRDDVDPDRSPDSYQRRIVAREALQYHRRSRARREVLIPPDDQAHLRDAGLDPEEVALLREERALLEGFIAQIDASRRAIYVEHHLHGVPVEEIAERHGIPLGTAKTRLKLAREEVKAARARWEAEQRRHTRDIPLPFLLPAQRRDLVARLRRLGAKVRALAGSAAIVAGMLLLMAALPSPPAYRPLLRRLPAAGLLSLMPGHDDDRQGASPMQEPAALTPAPAPALALVPAPAGAVSWSRRERPGYSPQEDSLIGRAHVATLAGDRGLAWRLLGDHARQFPRGRRAPEREALLQKMR